MILQSFLAQVLVNGYSIAKPRMDFKPKLGINTFVGYMPSSVPEGVLFTNNLPLVIDHYNKLLNGGAQIVVRASDPARADLLARQIIRLVQGWEYGSVENDGIRVLKILPRTEPLTYPRQDTGYFEASVNFDVTCTFQ